MAVILSIDTATEVCSVCLSKDGEVVAIAETMEPNSHSLQLGNLIQKVFSESRYDIQNIDAVAISEGPGSYTGLRIGVSMAKGICFSSEKPLISVGTINALAMGMADKFDENHILVPMIDARRMEVYTAKFDHLASSLSTVYPEIINQNSFAEEARNKKIVLFGNGAKKCYDIIDSNNKILVENVYSSSRHMVNIAHEKLRNQEFVDVAYFEPLYLKEFIAAKPVVKGLV